MKKYQLIGPFEQILTLSNLPLKGALKEEQLEIISQGGILLEGQKIKAIGNFNDLKNNTEALQPKTTLISGRMVALPGFVDAHTHICFGGSRAKDYAMRNAGKTYLEIAKSGGGIWDTVTQTRALSQEALEQGVVERAQELLHRGITTVEVKSGYGLSIAEELKMLRAIQNASKRGIIEIVPTCLAAHILPKDFAGNHKDYLEYISNELFPILVEEKLCNRIDAFVEEEAFSPKITISYLEKAKKKNFDITVHADQFSTGGSEVAITLEALSADHLEASTSKEIVLLAQSNTIAMALPGASIGLGCAFTPARKILDAGGAVAIASDWNPGSAPMGNLLTQASILGTFEKLSNAEILAGITFRAAAALKLDGYGKIAPKYWADIIAFPVADYQEIFYRQGQIAPLKVWKKGQLVIDKNKHYEF